MDDLVQQAMAKWPHVPDCFGWLGLDARGDWYMRDEQAQAKGSFAKSKGSRLQHEKLIDFIGRNYESDKQGRWYFQNGPQRVYVELEVTPWIWRIQPDGTLHTHTGQAVRMQRCYADELGRLFIETDHGIGLVHTQDMHLAVDPIEQGLWVLKDVNSQTLAQQFGFITSPQITAIHKK
jgi:hypothetical protein